MTITKIRTFARSGHNGRPVGGDVWFADGASYGFFVNAYDNSIWFNSHRKRQGTWEAFSFQSPKRAAALLAGLEG